MRLDLFLKKTALIRQRGLANDLCRAGAVLVDGRVSKASHEVREGERIKITMRSRRLVVRVLAVPHGNVARRDAGRYVEVLSDERMDRVARVLDGDDDVGGEVEMVTEHLRHMLRTNDSFVRECVKDITHEESLVRPQPTGNSFHWVLGHMVVYRDALLELLSKPRQHPASALAQFKRNAVPGSGDHDVRLETLITAFERAGVQLQNALEIVTPAQLAAPYNDKYAVEHRLVHLIWHEAYHVGQLGMLRRLAGKERVV